MLNLKWFIFIATMLGSAELVIAAEIQFEGPGCRDKKLSEQIYTALHVDKNKKRYATLIAHGFGQGNCTFFEKHDKVIVWEKGIFDLSCIGRPGVLPCYWVLPSMAK